MAKQTINIGETANDGTGDQLRTAFDKTNDNFDELYLAASGGSPLTTKGDIFAFDTADARLPVGTDDYVLTADSTTASGLAWKASGGGSPLTTKGDIFAFDTDDARLPVGTDDYVLTADSTTASGLAWKASGGGGTETAVDYFIDTSVTELDLSAGTFFTAEDGPGQSTAFVFNNPNPPGTVTRFTLVLVIAGSFTHTWPPSVIWPESVEPTWSTTSHDLVTFVTSDGGITWHGYPNGMSFG